MTPLEVRNAMSVDLGASIKVSELTSDALMFLRQGLTEMEQTLAANREKDEVQRLSLFLSPYRAIVDRLQLISEKLRAR